MKNGHHAGKSASATAICLGILDPGAYDTVVALEAPDDETMSAFILKVGSLGNAKDQTVRAFRRNETEGILAKIK